MVRLSHLALLSIAAVIAQDGGEPRRNHDVKRCTPKVVKHAPIPKHLTVGAQKGERATGYSPLISFQILESGEVTSARVRRSSGFAKVDKYALEWIRRTKYNARSGCGVLDSEASVSIHWTSGN